MAIYQIKFLVNNIFILVKIFDIRSQTLFHSLAILYCIHEKLHLDFFSRTYIALKELWTQYSISSLDEVI